VISIFFPIVTACYHSNLFTAMYMTRQGHPAIEPSLVELKLFDTGLSRDLSKKN